MQSEEYNLETDLASDKENDDSDDTKRGTWASQWDSLMSCLGYSRNGAGIMLGFFSYNCHKYGGTSFIIVYLIMMIVLGFPLLLMEMVLGQHAREGPIRLFGKMAPIAKGLGHAMMFTSGFAAVYYNLSIAWSIFYTLSGFQSELPWTHCKENVTSRECYTEQQAEACNNVTEAFWNNKCTSVKEICEFYGRDQSDEYDEKTGQQRCLDADYDTWHCEPLGTISIISALIIYIPVSALIFVN